MEKNQTLWRKIDKQNNPKAINLSSRKIDAITFQ